MDIQIATNKIQWNKFLQQNPRDGLFLQSWEWGELLEKTGQRVERLQVIENNAVVAQAQVVYKKTPLGLYALAAKGPVVKYQVESIKYKVFEALGNHLKQKNCIFFRIEPSYLVLNTLYFIHEIKDINPPATLVLDVTSTEAELLKNMHEKTRYNIRLAEKKGLRVTVQKNFDIFWELLQKTGQRDDFVLHSKESYQAIMATEGVWQLIVWSGNVPVATAGLVGFGDTMYYLYGASDHAYRQLMGPHLMQWDAIKLAKKLGFKYYDFFGVAPSLCHPDDAGGISVQSSATEISRGEPPRNDSKEYEYDPNHRYAGVTRFKLGFGGQVHEEPGTFDLIIAKNKYRVYQLVRRVRQIF